jgi:hypothetical protein
MQFGKGQLAQLSSTDTAGRRGKPIGQPLFA